MGAGTYIVEKSRDGHEGTWNSWGYSAKEEKSPLDFFDQSQRPIGAGVIHRTLDDLARALATLPHIELADFVPGILTKGRPTVSISDSVLTQWAPASNEELGELASLVQKYSYSLKK